jgi:hypothetical protein
MGDLQRRGVSGRLRARRRACAGASVHAAWPMNWATRGRQHGDAGRAAGDRGRLPQASIDARCGGWSRIPKWVSWTNAHMPCASARVGILTHALHYGTGVFEGIRAHWDEAGAGAVCHAAPWSTTSAGSRTAASCASMFRSPERAVRHYGGADAQRNAFRTNVYVRPLAYKSAERIGVAPTIRMPLPSWRCPSASICTRKGLHAGVSSWRRIDDNAIPARAKSAEPT